MPYLPGKCDILTRKLPWVCEERLCATIAATEGHRGVDAVFVGCLARDRGGFLH